MNDHPDTFVPNMREVIGAWIVCLAMAAAVFGHPPIPAARDAFFARHHDAVARPSLDGCARTPQQSRADRANAPGAA